MPRPHDRHAQKPADVSNAKNSRHSQWWLHLAVAFSAASIPVTAGAGGNSSHTALKARVKSLPFSSTEPPEHLMTVDVGVYFEHLYVVNSAKHVFDADLWLVYRWQDPRNYTALFDSNPLVEVEDKPCSIPDRGEDVHRLLQSARGLAAPGTRYLELDHDALGLFWQPDLHIRNLGSGGPKLYAELARFYEDGTFEFLRLVSANLYLDHPYYGAYPFDKQTLTVQIESMAHTTKQIQVRSLDAFSGLNFAYTSEWPGWSPVKGGIKWTVEETLPHYIYEAANNHRCERRSRYHLDIDAQRQTSAIIDSTLIPLMMQVAITWTGFYINVKVLMPRVAVAFISYLTLNNAASSLSAGLPPVSYPMFVNVFILFQRLMVIVGLVETACTFYITERKSARVGASLDKLSRVFVPLDYIVFSIIMFTVCTTKGTEDHTAYEDTLHVFMGLAWANFVLLFVVGALWCVYNYRHLYQEMMQDPLKLHESATLENRPLDFNELSMFFRALNQTVPGSRSGVIRVPGLVSHIVQVYGNSRIQDRCDDVTADVLAKIPGKRSTINLETFIAHYKAIMAEISIWCDKHEAGPETPTAEAPKDEKAYENV